MTPSTVADFAPSYTWLHLSDIHTGHGGAWRRADQQLVLEELSKDIVSRGGGELPSFDSVFLAGDIAATGAVRSSEEYRQFARWLDEILAKCETEPSEVFVVPGNHDVQREPAGSPERRSITRLRRRPMLDEAVEDPELRALLRKRQARFARWARVYGSSTVAEAEVFSWRHRRDLPGDLRLRLVGLNTALLCANDHDKGKLELGSGQILYTLGNPQDADDELVVVLAHHPFDWLRDQLNAEGWVRKRAHVYLSGHVHRARSEQVLSGSGQGLVTVAAGAVHEPVSSAVGPPPQHGYNVASVGRRKDGTLVLRVWSRIWSADDPRFCANTAVCPDGQTFAEHEIDFDGGRVAARRKHARRGRSGTKQVTLEQLAGIAHRDAGTRRTAYPSDMSFAELHEQGLHIEPRFDGGASIEDVADLAGALSEQRNALVLGDPGAGKSFASFMVLDELRQRKLIALTIDLGELTQASSTSDKRPLTRSAVVRSVSERLTGSKAALAPSRQPLVLVIDGIDELLNTGRDIEEIASDLAQLNRLGTLLITCRIREYRDILATHIPGMDVVTSMRPWDFTNQFSSFVKKLAAASLLTDPAGVMRLVGDTPTLQKLVARPLYARMLTYVMESGGSEVTDQPSLYNAYLSHLAKATDTSLARAGCEGHDVYALWRSTVWWALSNELMAEDGTPFTPLLSYLDDQGVHPPCAVRMFSTLVDTVQVFDELQARFLHFSFFEYLVGEEAARRLREGAGGPAPLGSVDLTLEMRHFMMWIVNHITVGDLAQRLANSYRASSQLPLRERLVANNLLAYVLGHMNVPQRRLLHDLLAEEDQPMLRTSLYWALCGAGDEDALIEYVKVMREDRMMADLNRGYLRYYYGDITQHEAPPYVDDEPYGPWAGARRRTVEMMTETDYGETIQPSRQLLDVATFVDFLETRDAEPDHTEHLTLAAVLEGVRPRLETREARALVDDLFNRVGGAQLSWVLPV